MKRTLRAKRTARTVAPTPALAAARARYSALVRDVRSFAGARLAELEKEAGAFERSARKRVVATLRLVAKELRSLEKEVERLETLVAPPVAKRRRARTAKARAAKTPAPRKARKLSGVVPAVA